MNGRKLETIGSCFHFVIVRKITIVIDITKIY
jgi:hypothetical protein